MQGDLDFYAGVLGVGFIMEYIEVAEIVGTVGVPTAVLFYVLHTVKQEIKELNSSIQQLNYILRANYIRHAPI